MKRLIFMVCGTAIFAGLIGYLNQRTAPLPSQAPATAEPASGQPVEQVQEIENITAHPATAHPRSNSPSILIQPVPISPSPPLAEADPDFARRAVDALVSAQVTYVQKQAAWRQLIEAGKLDEAIAELERRMAS